MSLAYLDNDIYLQIANFKFCLSIDDNNTAGDRRGV